MRSRVPFVGVALGLLFVLYGAADRAHAHSGDGCFGWIHETQLASGLWTFHSIDCDEDPCPPPGGGACELAPVSNSGGLKWRCGCGGAEDGSCDATQVQGGAGTRGICNGSCSSGTCNSGGASIEWTENGINHRLRLCGCS